MQGANAATQVTGAGSGAQTKVIVAIASIL